MTFVFGLIVPWLFFQCLIGTIRCLKAAKHFKNQTAVRIPLPVRGLPEISISEKNKFGFFLIALCLGAFLLMSIGVLQGAISFVASDQFALSQLLAAGTVWLLAIVLIKKIRSADE